MEKYVLHFNEIDKTSLPYVGGKGANLGEMTKAGFPVPQGFCITTQAYKAFIETSSEMNELFEALKGVSHTELQQISVLGQRIREHISTMVMPKDIETAILSAFKAAGKNRAYAVRSSATAEDLPTASFAGQQDTYLNIQGQEQLLEAVQKCWASLFTDRAISYRAKNNFDHRMVLLSVVVQQMVFPEVSGIMFTADPIKGRRGTLSIDASFGLGEALVSGLVTADLYQVRYGEIIKKQISKKKLAIYGIPEGGTITKELPLEKQEVQALSDEGIKELAALGKRIEAHYGSEQDIEWGYSEGKFYILQSRPITSLYPLPPVKDDKFHVFISFGHIQMMTDTMKPLSISLLKNIVNFLKTNPLSPDEPYILEAGGRLFADITGLISVKPVRNRLLKVFNEMDELLASALAEAVGSEDFTKVHFSKGSIFGKARKLAPIILPAAFKVARIQRFEKNPEVLRIEADDLLEELSLETEKVIFNKTGVERIRQIQIYMGNMLSKVLSKVAIYWVAGVIASGKLKKLLLSKVSVEEYAQLLSRLNKSLPGNVTTELGLKVADLSDTARKHPEVVSYLETANNNRTFYKDLCKIRGGVEFKQELEAFLRKYGMRCSGEIDITKPRWYEEPLQLIPSILSNIKSTAPGEHLEKFKQGEIEAEMAAEEILSKFISSERKKVVHLIKLYRNLMGMREHHKFAVIKQLDIFKRGILAEGRTLVEKGLLQNEQDVFYFTIPELIALEENKFKGDPNTHIDAIKNKYEQYEKLTPPRVMTSEGEIITGRRRDVKAPAGALVGIPVSSGIIEGTARVITKLEDANLNPGEILIAPYTDPGWTPPFTSAVGLITEVGGMMTHGSVIAREYGIPAVVGIEKATELIKDGALIRVNGTEGYVEILS